VVALGCAVALGAAVYAFGGHQPSGVASYTGCLSTPAQGGVVYYLAQGNTPAGTCRAGNSQVHLSGGDITAINAVPD
jgi:hypothetical protein